MKFTGHERDLASPTGVGDDLDYMHARHESPVTGRFLSVDRVNADPKEPRSWNRYSYTLANPIKYFDPDGQYLRCPPSSACAPPHTLWEKIKQGLYLASILPGPMALESVPEALGSVFALTPTARGVQIESDLAAVSGGALPRSFPVIDRFLSGVATSVKSIDLAAPSYSDAAALGNRLKGFVDKLASFQGATFANTSVKGSEISSRVLELVVQRGAATPEQIAIIKQYALYAQKYGVQFKVILVK